MRALVILCVAVACGPPVRPTQPLPHSPQPHSSPDPRVMPTTDNPPPPLAPPTTATAGAKACRLGTVVTLGPHARGKIALAFDGASGMAAWISAPRTLALQPLARDGSRTGASTTVAIPGDVEPDSAYAVGNRFVILVRLWDWQNSHVAWWAVSTDRDARAPSPATALALDDLDFLAAVPVDSEHLALHVGPAYIAKDKTIPPRWVTVSTDAANAPTISPTIAVPSSASLPPDAITTNIFNGAEPPPPGAGGRIYEAMGRPVLERTHAGQRVGDPIDLEWHGNPIAHGMMISTDLAWSGTHFLYPFTDGEARLLPIDCRP